MNEINKTQVIGIDTQISVVEVGVPGPMGDITPELEAVRKKTVAEVKALADTAVRAKDNAEEAAREAKDVVSGIKVIEAKRYDPAEAYDYPDLVISPTDGGVYRCIRPSQGEDPAFSDKWSEVAMIISETFEKDENGDLMPRANPRTSQRWDLDEKGQIMPL